MPHSSYQSNWIMAELRFREGRAARNGQVKVDVPNHRIPTAEVLYFRYDDVQACSMCACLLMYIEERCSSETLQLRCPAGGGGSDVTVRRDHVIAVKQAWYGRMRPAQRCISAVYAESLGCRADVTAYLHSVCSGRRNCTLLVATMDSVIQPCPKDFKSYLEITYECIRGKPVSKLNSSRSATSHSRARQKV